MATQINVWVLPNKAVWIDGNNVPSTADVPMNNGTIEAAVPISFAEVVGQPCPGLFINGLPKLIQQAEAFLVEQNAVRTNGTTRPDNVVGVKITLNQA